ncbi:hypothetical protein [Saccharothrix sp. HUAS TT1]|uniref:hypothetical protein n=1 Tax=unclassified Saccharothrix TaxID=2593673 RepID=UPI00345BC02F
MTSGYDPAGYYAMLACTPPEQQPRPVLELLAYELHLVAMGLEDRARQHERADPDGGSTVIVELRHLAGLIEHRADGYRARPDPPGGDDRPTIPHQPTDPATRYTEKP